MPSSLPASGTDRVGGRSSSCIFDGLLPIRLQFRLLAAKQRGGYVPPSTETVGTFLLEDWLPGQRSRLRPSTWESYRAKIETYVIPRIGQVRLQNINPAALNNLYAELLESGRADGGGLSPRTVQYVHAIVRKAFGDREKWGKLARNPAGLASPPRRSSSQRTAKIRTWTAEEVQTFLAGQEHDPLHLAWRLAFTTGMRRGEILGLVWSNVDLPRSRLSVTQSLVTVNGRTQLSPPKTAKGRRVVALDEKTVGVLRSHRVRQAEEKLLLGSGYEDHGLVICQANGRPIDPDAFSGMFRRAVKQAGLPPIRLHDARHTHATLALAAGIHVKVVSERLGHSSIALTLDTYSHAIPALQEAAAEQIAALFADGR